MPPNSSPSSRKRLRQRFGLAEAKAQPIKTRVPASPKNITRISPQSSSSPDRLKTRTQNAGVSADLSRVLQLQTNQGLARRMEEDVSDDQDFLENKGSTREDLLAQAGSGDGGSVLDLAQDPLAQQGSYGRSPTAPPGSAVDPSDSSAEQKGGYLASDDEQRAALLEKQKQQARTQQLLKPGGGRKGLPTAGEQPRPEQQAPSRQPQAKTGKRGSDQLDQAEQVASLLKIQKAQQAIRRVQEIKEIKQRIQRISKGMKTFWNLMKTGQLVAGVSVVSLGTLWFQLHVQMINKIIKRVSDKEVPIIGKTYWYEDILIVCADCTAVTSAIAASPCCVLFITALLITIAAFGLFSAFDYFGIFTLIF